MGRKSKSRLSEEQLEIFRLKFSDPDLIKDYKDFNSIPSKDFQYLLCKYPYIYKYYNSRRLQKTHLINSITTNPEIIDHVPSLKLTSHEVTHIFDAHPSLLYDDDFVKKVESLRMNEYRVYSVGFLLKSLFIGHFDRVWEMHGDLLLSGFDKLYYRTKFLIYCKGKVPHDRLTDKDWKSICGVSGRLFDDPVFDSEVDKYITETVKSLGEDRIRYCMGIIMGMDGLDRSYRSSFFFSMRASNLLQLMDEHYSASEILKYTNFKKIGSFGVELLCLTDAITMIDFRDIKSLYIKQRILYYICKHLSFANSQVGVGKFCNIRWDTIKSKRLIGQVLRDLTEYGDSTKIELIIDKFDRKYLTAEVRYKYF